MTTNDLSAAWKQVVLREILGEMGEYEINDGTIEGQFVMNYTVSLSTLNEQPLTFVKVFNKAILARIMVTFTQLHRLRDATTEKQYREEVKGLMELAAKQAEEDLNSVKH